MPTRSRRAHLKLVYLFQTIFSPSLICVSFSSDNRKAPKTTTRCLGLVWARYMSKKWNEMEKSSYRIALHFSLSSVSAVISFENVINMCSTRDNTSVQQQHWQKELLDQSQQTTISITAEAWSLASSWDCRAYIRHIYTRAVLCSREAAQINVAI